MNASVQPLTQPLPPSLPPSLLPPSFLLPDFRRRVVSVLVMCVCVCGSLFWILPSTSPLTPDRKSVV
jgi:hypothetical protein